VVVVVPKVPVELQCLLQEPNCKGVLLALREMVGDQAVVVADGMVEEQDQIQILAQQVVVDQVTLMQVLFLLLR
jgi:hypothetical protein